MIYNYENKNEFLRHFDNIPIMKKTASKTKYYNVSVSFDIETSSIYVDENGVMTDDTNCQKISNMYIWQLAINDNVIIGRYWKQFIELINDITLKLNTNENNRLIIYVHNLAYEFQYIYKIFNWLNVFAIDERRPIYALTNQGVEFRCSYILTGYNLNTLAKNLQNKTIKKLVGDLDYTKIRHNETPLTEKELEYCINDVLIVTQYINEQILEYDGVGNIPLTQTGKVRRYVKNVCFKNKDYRFTIKDMKLNQLEYKSLLRCYSGGFTHSNAIRTNIKLNDVASYDFTSSYPYVMLSEKYPMSSGRKVKINSVEQFENYLENYCCLFTITLYNVKPKTLNENILQFSKCYNIEKPLIINNGRIVEVGKCSLVVNEIDFKNINNFYTYEHLEVGNFYIYDKDYLPKEIIESVLTLYEKKTELKGVEGMEKEYLNAKEQINSMYGMCVTNTMKENVLFNGVEWVKDENYNLDKKIDDYNNDKTRFLFYPWGVWITSYARHNLLNGVLEMGQDYIYADTDSLKILNKENHQEYFTNYNNEVETKLKNMCEYYNIDFNRCKPKTIKGVEKLIGVWDYEGTYKHFKTLGAKRYIVQKDDDSYEITVAGLSKKAIDYIELYSKDNNIDVFEAFNNFLYVPTEYTRKNTHTYIDKEMMCMITDYQGKTKKVLCKSGVHLSPCDFTLNLNEHYIEYLLKAKNYLKMEV